MFVARIHNSSLGSCFEVSCEEDGIAMIIDMAEAQLGRKLDDSEIEEIKNNLDFYNDDDPDNIYCFSLGAFS